MLKRITSGSIALLAAITLASCGGSSGSSADGGTDKLKVVMTSPVWTVELAHYGVAEQLGFYKDEGLDVEFSLAPSGTQSVQQVVGGSADIAVATPEPVVIANEKGGDLRYFLPDYGQFIYQVAAVDGSGIKQISDLKGKKIGVTNVGSTGRTFAVTALKAVGLKESDVTFVPVGVGPQEIQAVKRGQVDALATWDTNYVSLANQGIKTSVLPAEGIDGLFAGGAVATEKKISGDADALERWGRATAKGMAFAAAHPEEATELMWKAHPETAPPAGQDRGAALKAQTKIVAARMNLVVPDPSTTAFTTFSMEMADNYAEWAKGAGLIKTSLSAAEFVDSSLSKSIGDFDPTDATEAKE